MEKIQRLIVNDIPDTFIINGVNELYTNSNLLVILYPNHNKIDILDTNENNYIIKNKSYQKYFYIKDSIVLIHLFSKTYLCLFNGIIFQFIYEYDILGISNNNCHVFSIFTSKGTMSIVRDKYGNYQMIEIFDYLVDRRDDEDINGILRNNIYRHIPMIEIEF